MRTTKSILTIVVLTAALAAVGFSLLNARSTGASESELSGTGVAPEIFAERNTEPADGMWRDIDKSDLMAGTNADELPVRFRALKLDSGQMKQFLAQLPNEDLSSRSVRNPLVALPMPGGGFARFEVAESPSVEAPLLKEFPFLKTYRGQGVDDRSATVRMDFTPAGFHAIVLSADGVVYIDPLKNQTDDLYVSYFKKDRGSSGDFACGVDSISESLTRENPPADVSSGSTLRTYVIAIGANGEWTQAHGGGTVAGALAEITSILNRTNAIWEREFSIRFLLTASNAAVVFTNPATDPFANSRDIIINQSHPELVSRLGIANFDVGHVFYEGDNGGVAATPATCNPSLKGFGVSGQVTNTNLDTFDHELGHQFNANHTFNRSFIDNGNDQRFPPTAFEPALGSTFMGYGFNNESYHGASIAEITSFAAIGGDVCADRFVTGNSIPTVTAGGPYNVPKQTPFKLTAAALDGDGDTLTYDWQENDLGPTFVVPPTGYVQDNDADGNARPIFRNYPPTANPSRTFPSVQYILDYANVPPPIVSCGPGNIVCLTDEILPSITRTMNFQVVVRDNRSGAGAVNSATSTVQIDGASGPFLVTSPNTPVVVAPQSAMTVTWDVANTNSAPVSTAAVNILLSTDGGATFPYSLVAGTPNDGSQTVAIPNVTTTAARIKVEAVGNIFFDISDADFTIVGCLPAPSGLVSWYRGQTNATDSAGANDGNANGNGFADAKVGKGFDIQNTAGITVADDASLNLQNFTIESWVRSSPFSGSKFIAAKSGSDGLSGYEFGMIDGLLRFTLNGGAGGADLIDDVNIADGAFHHVAATYDGTTMRIFLDGTVAAETLVTTTLGFESGGIFVVGNRQHLPNVSVFGGLIDELSIYNRALTESEIQSVFNSANVGKCVAGGVQISPVSQTVNPGNTISFSASGGVPPYDFAFASNISGGSINPATGLYTAGAALGTDVIRVTDGKTDVAFATIRVAAPCIAGQKTWDGDGSTNNWSEAANWTCDQVPASGNTVIFSGVSTKDATVDTNVSINTFNINTGYTGAITLSNGISMTVAGSSTQNAGTLNVGGGTLNLNGTFNNLNGGALNANFGTVNVGLFMTIAGGTFDGGSALLTIPVVDVTGGTFVSTTGTLVVSQNIQRTAGTLDLDNGTIYFNGFSNGAVSGISTTFKNLTIGKGDNVGVSFTGTNIVTGTLTLTDGLLNAGTLEARGPVNIADTFGRTNDAGAGVIAFRNGTEFRTVTLLPGTALPDIIVSDPLVSITSPGIGGTIRSDSITLEDGTIDLGPMDLIFGYTTAVQGSTYTQSGGTFGTFGTITWNTAGNFTLSNGNFIGGQSMDLTNCLVFSISGGTFNPPSGGITINAGINSAFQQSGGLFAGTAGNVDINGAFRLSGGEFVASAETTSFGFTFEHSAGTFSHSLGTVIFDSPHPSYSINAPGNEGTEVFNNVTVNLASTNGEFTQSGDYWEVGGTLRIVNGRVNAGSAPGTGRQGAFVPKGDVVIENTADGGNAEVRFGGTANQTFTNNGGPNFTGALTVDKPSGTVNAGGSLVLSPTTPLNITSGTLYIGNNTNVTAGAVTIGANGRLVNDSATTITLGGNLVNNGTVDLQGGGAACPEADAILIRSSANGTQRTWTGNGLVRIVDADVRDMAGTSAITAYSSTNTGNNGANWTFDSGCPALLSISPLVANKFIGETQTFTAGGGFAPRTFSIAVNNSGATINPSSGLYTAGNTFDVTDTVRVTDGFGTTADATINVSAGPPTQLGFVVQPSNATAGQSIAPSVQVAVQDPSGNTVTGATDAVTISIANNPGGSTLGGTVTRNAVNGIATFNDLSLDRVGTGYTLSAAAANLTSATSGAFNITFGAPSGLAFTVQPSNAAANTIIAPAIQVAVVDAFGNLVTSATNSVSIAIAMNPAGGVLAGTLTRNAVSGTAVFDNLSIDRIGNGYTLTTTSPGLAGNTSQVFDVLSPFVVRNLNDSGPASLRSAIIAANSTPGADSISFDIPGSGPYSIALGTQLPTITEALTIDGTTQPGFSGTPIIELNGSGVVGPSYGLLITSSDCVIKGLVINRFFFGIQLSSRNGPGRHVVEGNYIGTNLAGTASLGNTNGIVVGSSDNVIGGDTVAERNVVSGNTNVGIFLSNDPRNIVNGNLVGTDATGITSIPNGVGIVSFSDSSVIGGVSNGEGNLVAFNQQEGIRILSPGNRTSIRGNSIHSNGGLGIDLSANGVTPNDPGDSDSGANSLLNFPVLALALGGANTTIQGTLNSRPSANYTLDFYSSPNCDASGYGEGTVYLGSSTVSTDATNLSSFNVVIPATTMIGHFVTATATDSQGNTSEFSTCRVVSQSIVSISGSIQNNLGAPIKNSQVQISGGQNATTMTDMSGNYTFNQLPSGFDYTVTPAASDHSFAPTSRTLTGVTNNQTGQNFTGTKTKFTLAGGLIGMVNGVPIPLSDVTVILSGTASSTYNGSAFFVFPNLLPGTYTLTPIKEGWTFSPPSVDVNLTTANQQINLFAIPSTPLEGRVFFYPSGWVGSVNANGTAFKFDLTSRVVSSRADVSPDGRKIVYVRDNILYSANSDGSSESMVTSPSGGSSAILSPEWSPDGMRISYILRTSGSSLLRTINSTGGGVVNVPIGSLTEANSPGWINSGRLVFSASDGNDREIYAINTDGTGLSQLTNNNIYDDYPRVSYDGSRISYVSSSSSGNRINDLFVMNADGSGKTQIRSDVSRLGHGWSPDGSKMVVIRELANGSARTIAINSITGSQTATIYSGRLAFANWGRDLESLTPAGSNVAVSGGGVNVTFGGVSTPGITTFVPLPASTAGTAPNGFALGGQAYEITTTAAYTSPVTVCLTVPTSIQYTAAAFNQLSLFHNDGGVLVDRTTSRDFATRTVCGSVSTLSPFVLGELVDPALPSITGLVEDENGNPRADVFVQLTGTENRTAVTDQFGIFSFVNLTAGGNYSVQPKEVGYLFSEYSQDFVGLTGENSVVFTGTSALFEISGRVTDANGAAVAGLTMEIDGSAGGSAVTDANGDYVFTDLPADGSYSVTPLGNGFSYSPASQTVDALTSNAVGLDFTQLAPTAAAVSVGGRVLTPNGTGLKNVFVTITGGNLPRPLTFRTNDFGYYRFEGIEVGQSYIVSVASRRYVFTEPTRIVSVDDNVTDADFRSSGEQ